jgi:hypothetical protein
MTPNFISWTVKFMLKLFLIGSVAPLSSKNLFLSNTFSLFFIIQFSKLGQNA